MAFSLSSKATAFAVGLLCWSLGGIAFAADPLVGTLPGDFSVDNKGAANYSIPLPLPPGRQGMQPKLSLQYSSQAGNGPLGVGFSISTGFPQAITRGRTIQARDGETRGVVFDNTKDKLYLDGKRLVCTSESTYSYGAPGSTYRTEVDSFVSITTAGSGGNIETFVVTDKSGTKMTFGKTPAPAATTDGYQQAGGESGALAHRYALKRVEDTVGNSISFTYDTTRASAGEYVLASISYTGGPSEPPHEISFLYTGRTDTVVSYLANRSFTHSRRLSAIEVRTKPTGGSATLVSRFDLSYEYAPAGGRSRLIGLTPSFRDGSSLVATPPSEFSWSNGDAQLVPDSRRILSDDDVLNQAPYSNVRYAQGDFDGDGRKDQVDLRDGLTVRLSRGADFVTEQWMTAGNLATTPMDYGLGSLVPLDLNGDGKTDLLITDGLCHNIFAVISTGTTFVGLSNGAAPTHITSTDAVMADPSGNSWALRGVDEGAAVSHVVPADYTGDGREDFVVHGYDGHLYLFKSTGTGFAPFKKSTERVAANGLVDPAYLFGAGIMPAEVRLHHGITPMPMDVDGDGRADYVWTERANGGGSGSDPNKSVHKQLLVSRVRPDGEFPLGEAVGPPQTTFTYSSGVPTTREQALHAVLPGDFNGDGLPDFLIGVDPTKGGGLRWLLMLNQGAAGKWGGGGRATTGWGAVPNSVTVSGYTIPTVNFPATEQHWNGSLSTGGTAGGTAALFLRIVCSNGQNMFVADINGDELSDFVWYAYDCPAAARGWYVLYSDGNGSFVNPTKLPIAGTIWGQCSPVPAENNVLSVDYTIAGCGDIDGDGLSDHSVRRLENAKATEGYASVVRAAGTFSDLMLGARNGLGSSLAVSYKAARDDSLYTPGGAVAYPIRELRSSAPVVSDLYRDCGSADPSGRARFSYQYSGRRLDLSGRGDLGFHAFVTLDRQTNLFKYQFLAQSFPMTGLTAREQTYRYWDDGANVKFRLVNSHDNTVVFDEVVNPAASNAPWGTVYPFVSQAVEYRWEDSLTQAHFTLPKAGGPETKPEALFTAARPLGHHIAITAASLFDNQTTVLTALPGTYAASDRAKSTTDRTLDWSAVGLNTVAGATDYAAFHALFGGSDYRKITYGNLRQLSTDFGDGFTEQVETTYKPPVGALTGLVDTVKTTVGWKENGIAKNAVAPLKTYTYWGATPLVATETINAGDAVVTNAEAKLTTTTTYARDTLGRVTSTTLSGYFYPGAEGATVLGTVADDNDAARHVGAFTNATFGVFDAAWDQPTSVANAYGHTTTTAYHPFLGLPTSVTGSNDDIVSTSYDALGRTVKVRDVLRNLETTTTFTWDTSQTVAPPANATGIGPGAPIVGVVAITGKSVYAVRTTATAQPPVTSYFDRLGRTIRTVKEGFGNKKAVTDTVYNTLGQVTAVSLPYDPADAATGPFWTRTAYDALGRIVTVNAPNGTVTTHTYRGRCTTVTVTAPDRDPQSNTTFVDAKGRTIKVWNADIAPVFTPIDPTTSASTSGTPASIEYTLDGFGRMLTTVLNNQAQPITATYDALGRQLTLNDPDKGNWTYLNNALGHVVYQKDAKETVTRSTFDRLGRPLSRRTAETTGPVEDSAWSYYDTAANASGAAGTAHHLVAKGDQGWIGAPHRERSSTTGAPGYAATAGASATETLHYYDSLGRPAIVLSGIDGKWFYTCTEYDAAGRVAAVRHFWKPTGHEAPGDQPYVWQDFGYSYTYDSESYLLELRDATGQIWWEADPAAGYDHLDRPVLVRKGHGHWTRRTYRATDGTLAALNTGPTAGSGSVQNLRFEFDGLGNLTTRADDLAGLSETFGYDALNRLTKRGGEAVVAYHANGNINWKRDVTGYQSPAFAYSPTKPHAVTSAFGCTMTYDANGNLLTRTGANGEEWATRWAGFDKPRWLAKTVGATTAGSEFVYNANRSRVLQIEFDSVNGTGVSATPKHYTRKRLYAWGATGEIDYANQSGTGVPPVWTLQTIRLYVPGPDGVIGAMEFWPNGPVEKNPRPLVYHYDHLGSVAVVTPLGDRTGHIARDDNGKQARHSFDAWGQRRDPVDWTGVPVDTSAGGPSAVAPRGFTGHEMMDGQGLVNMNGRIYDALLGRFLSADILVENPANLQCFNRYSYVRNNPLSLTDPSGFASAALENDVERAAREEMRRKQAETRANGLSAQDMIAQRQVGGAPTNSNGVAAQDAASTSAAAANGPAEPQATDRLSQAAPKADKGATASTVNPSRPPTEEAKDQEQGKSSDPNEEGTHKEEGYLPLLDPNNRSVVYMNSGGMINAYNPVTGKWTTVGEQGMQDMTLGVAGLVVVPPVVKSTVGAVTGWLGERFAGFFCRGTETALADGVGQTVSISAHGMRHFAETAQPAVAAAIRQDLAAVGAVTPGQIVQRTITVGGEQVTYRAFGLKNGTVNVGTAFSGTAVRNIAAPR